jgi:hypothetical protein
MTDKLETVEVIKVIVLTVEEYEQQLNILQNCLQIHQEYSGQVTLDDLPIAIRELIKISHLVEASEQLLKRAVEARVIEERLLLVKPTQ